MTKQNKYFLSGAIILVIIFLSKKKLQNMNLTEDQVLSKLIPYMLKAEGGLSNDPKDSASKFPSPTVQKYHTNKGITYKTFINLASKLGYDPTIQNFLSMPNNIFLKIYKNGYYNNSNLTTNPLLKAYISLWLWGGWNKTIITPIQIKNILNANLTDLEKLKKLVDLRIIYFNAITKANPDYKKFLKGWTNRANEFYNLFAN
jgi:lysozyme family protein